MNMNGCTIEGCLPGWIFFIDILSLCRVSSVKPALGKGPAAS
jgi:hypothetical protein